MTIVDTLDPRRTHSESRPASLLGLGLLLTWLVASPAAADRACLLDPAITGRTCSEVQCLSLQAAVKSGDACGSAAAGNAPRACRNVSTCPEKLEQLRRWRNCAEARDRINAICWRGGDPGHTTASGNAWINVSNCVADIADNDCGDPCPWFAPLTSSPASASPDSVSPDSVVSAALADTRARAAAEATCPEGLDAATADALVPVLQQMLAEGLLDELLRDDLLPDQPLVEPAP